MDKNGTIFIIYIKIEIAEGDTYDFNSHYDTKTEDFLKVVDHINTSTKTMNYNEINYEKEINDSNEGYDLYSVNIKNNKYCLEYMKTVGILKKTLLNLYNTNYYLGYLFSRVFLKLRDYKRAVD